MLKEIKPVITNYITSRANQSLYPGDVDSKYTLLPHGAIIQKQDSY